MPCQFRWGQALLVGTEADPGRHRRYRVSNGSTSRPPTAALPLATAQARAVPLTSRPALVWADDGTDVTVTSTPAGAAVDTDDRVPWATACQSRLDRTETNDDDPDRN